MTDTTETNPILEANPELKDIGNYAYGWHDATDAGAAAQLDVVLGERPALFQLLVGEAQLQQRLVEVFPAQHPGEQAGRARLGIVAGGGVLEHNLLRQDHALDLAGPGDAGDVLAQFLGARQDVLRQILYHQGEGGGIIQVHQLVYKQLRRHEAEEGGRSVPAFGVDELDGLHHGLI